ncbi:MAG: transketolase [Pseudomonadota bacterium]
MQNITQEQLMELAKTLRYYALRMPYLAGSGHTSSALSAADLMAAFFATTFCYDFKNPNYPNNDRLIFSKGHATPLFYGLFAVAGAIKKQALDTYRKKGSTLEGHPTPGFKYTEAATGSLGQGLSVGVGLALNAKYLDKLNYRTFVLLGDGEMAEGSVWEAAQLASFYKLDNLIGFLDVNRLGQSGPTMLGHNVWAYKERLTAFGWEVVTIDGHDFAEILTALQRIGQVKDKPYMIIAQTFKGQGVSFIKDMPGWHGKPLKDADYKRAVAELGEVNKKLIIKVKKTKRARPQQNKPIRAAMLNYKKGEQVATRMAFGKALARLGGQYPQVVSLDGDVENSTYSEFFRQKFSSRSFEMFIAEQNMVGTAVGLAKRQKIPFVSTFAAFLTRAFDQIRLAAISQANIKFCGSHAGVSIGEDGPSQMGLEDLAMFRSVHGCQVLYPADAVAAEKLVQKMIQTKGLIYLRTSRPATPVIYANQEKFEIGGSKVHKAKRTKNKKTKAVVVAAGITLYEALQAQEELAKRKISIDVVDCYSIKPIDAKTLRHLAKQTEKIIVVEDHWFEGGLGDAVLNVFADQPKVAITKLAVSQMPRSGKPNELLDAAGISCRHIVKAVQN